ncbi:hypothetical protein BUE80_DR009069 [Diplocarpon rosae]|nr:hypothetical protein BUE80_DR009069 [Diplocarpon rosae]
MSISMASRKSLDQPVVMPDSNSEMSKKEQVLQTNGSERDVGDVETLEAQGHAKFNRLGWKRLTVVLLVEAIALGALSIPSAFATLGMVAGVITTIGLGLVAIYTMTVIATGVTMGHGGPQADWSAWPRADISFTDAFIAITNIVFAYSFAVCQFSFMDEMHTPKDYVRSIWALGLIEIVIYTVTGALIYAFVGPDVESPALLSAGTLMAKVAFGLALPVIFISGSINGTVVGRYIHGRMYQDSVVRFINTRKGWLTWIGLISAITLLAWVIAEAIPFFSDLLSICSALFISGFTFYFPATFWFMLIKEGKWYAKKNIFLSIVNALVFIIGMIVLVAGTYSSVVDIKKQYDSGTVRGAFTCQPLS